MKHTQKNKKSKLTKAFYKRVSRFRSKNKILLGHPGEITATDLAEIAEKLRCFYCDKKIDLANKGQNAFDRVVPSRGYTRENLVFCCKQCNNLKSNMELKDIERFLFAFLNFTPLKVEEVTKINTSAFYKKYVTKRLRNLNSSAARHGRVVTIDIDQIFFWLEQANFRCYYCNTYVKNNFEFDRFDSTGDYHLHNLVCSCPLCNRMKVHNTVESLELFYKKISCFLENSRSKHRR